VGKQLDNANVGGIGIAESITQKNRAMWVGAKISNLISRSWSDI
jgi:hypothetical protein